MKLPAIGKKVGSSSDTLIKDKFRLTTEPQKQINTIKGTYFMKKLNTIQEIKIFLGKNFNSRDIDDAFIKDIENEYAEQYLLKLEILPTKTLMKKVLDLKPLEKCDFFLSSEAIRNNNNEEKYLKTIHIYPGNVEKNNRRSTDDGIEKKNIKQTILKNMENSRLKKEPINEQEKIEAIKKQKTNTENLIYHKERLDNMITEAKDNILEVKLFNQRPLISVSLSPQNIREKYIITKSSEKNDPRNDIFNGRSKLYSISKSVLMQKNILTDPKFVFDITKIDKLTNEILKEVNEPIDAQLVIIMKDMSYILDNFPMENFVNVNNEEIKDSILHPEKPTIHKIKIGDTKDILKITKIFHSMQFYRLIGLTLNLIYWIVFGKRNNIQVDASTKEFLYLKLLKEIEAIQSRVTDPKLLSRLFIPLEVIFIRIEVDNYFSRKFVNLFSKPSNKSQIMEKVNNIITEIFDKHGYMNSFDTLCGDSKELNTKFQKNQFPHFKNKVYATSNYLEQLFNNDISYIGKDNIEEIEERRKFILSQKVDFFNEFLNKVNGKLKKRNLEPIFTLSAPKKVNNEWKERLVKKKDLNLTEGSQEKIKYKDFGEGKTNYRYDVISVAKYIENSKKKFRLNSVEPKDKSN